MGVFIAVDIYKSERVMIGLIEAASICFCQIAICKNTAFANALAAAAAINSENVLQLIQNAKLVRIVCFRIHETKPHIRKIDGIVDHS